MSALVGQANKKLPSEPQVPDNIPRPRRSEKPKNGSQSKAQIRRDVLRELCGSQLLSQTRPPRKQIRTLLGNMSRLLRLAENLSASRIGKDRVNNVKGMERKAKMLWLSAKDIYENLSPFDQELVSESQKDSLRRFIPLPPRDNRRTTLPARRSSPVEIPRSSNGTLQEDILIQMQAVSQLLHRRQRVTLANTPEVLIETQQALIKANNLLREVAEAKLSDISGIQQRVREMLQERNNAALS